VTGSGNLSTYRWQLVFSLMFEGLNGGWDQEKSPHLVM
jgi:hypothetical protein